MNMHWESRERYFDYCPVCGEKFSMVDMVTIKKADRYKEKKLTRLCQNDYIKFDVDLIDKYYSDLFNKKILSELNMYYLDKEIKEEKERIILYMKPIKYKNYTRIWSYKKEEALLKLIKFEKIISGIKMVIKYTNELNTWE